MTSVPRSHQVVQAVRQLCQQLPQDVHCRWMLEDSTPPALFPEESLAAASFIPSRRAEFALGRACAREALQALGIPSVAIPVGNHREPLWPPGTTGSISHVDGLAVAVAARSSHLAALGVDIERHRSSFLPPPHMVCRPEEWQALLALGLGTERTTLLAFSAKEAAYKALWPILGCFLDFHDLRLQLGPVPRTFTVRSRSPDCPPDLACALEGRFVDSQAAVATAAWISHSALQSVLG